MEDIVFYFNGLHFMAVHKNNLLLVLMASRFLTGSTAKISKKNFTKVVMLVWYASQLFGE